MPINVFRVRNDIQDGSVEFLQVFLQSDDFRADQLSIICKSLHLDTTVQKETMAKAIAEHVMNASSKQHRNDALDLIITELIKRPKFYLAAKYGRVKKHPSFNDARLLINARRNADWFGPISDPDNQEVIWYIKTENIPLVIDDHIERIEDNQQKFICRWKCYIRVEGQMVTAHWRGFTADTGRITIGKRLISGRFPYWYFVPRILQEFASLTGAQLEDLDWKRIILDTLWDNYRGKDNTKWDDIHIRSEHRGIALNARNKSSSVTILSDDNAGDIEGIKYLAETLGRAVEEKIKDKLPDFEYPDASEINEEILRTIIKDYNPQLYESAISENDSAQTEETWLFHCKAFFGTKPEAKNEDGFKHLRFIVKNVDVWSQWQLILRYFKPAIHLESTSPKQLSFTDKL